MYMSEKDNIDKEENNLNENNLNENNNKSNWFFDKPHPAMSRRYVSYHLNGKKIYLDYRGNISLDDIYCLKLTIYFVKYGDINFVNKVMLEKAVLGFNYYVLLYLSDDEKEKKVSIEYYSVIRPRSIVEYKERLLFHFPFTFTFKIFGLHIHTFYLYPCLKKADENFNTLLSKYFRDFYYLLLL